MLCFPFGKHKQEVRKSLQHAPDNGIMKIGVNVYWCVVDGGGVSLCPSQV